MFSTHVGGYSISSPSESCTPQNGNFTRTTMILRFSAAAAVVLMCFATGTAFSPLPLSSSSTTTTHLCSRRSWTIRCSIQTDVNTAMKTARKAKDSVTLSTVRSIKTAFTNLAKESGVDEIGDDQALTVLRKLAKQRQESIDMYTEAGADDRAASESAELKVIEKWLPSLADEATTRKWLEAAMVAAEEAGAAGNVGRIMGFLMKDHKADVDGKLAQKLLKEML